MNQSKQNSQQTISYKSQDQEKQQMQNIQAQQDFQQINQDQSQSNAQSNNQFTPQDVAFYIENLKRNYLERLEQFQMTIKDIYDRLEGDEVIDSLKNDPELESFRVERFKEILKQSFQYEQELYIDKMIEANSMLKLDLKKSEEEKYIEIEQAKIEIQNISKKVLEFESAIQQEAAQKMVLQNEYEKLLKQKNLEKVNYDELLKIKESSQSKQDSMYKQELQNSRMEIESLLKEKSNLQIQNEQMKDQIDTLTKNLQIYSQKQQARSETDRIYEQKNEEMKSIIQKLQTQIADLKSSNEHYIEQLQLKDQEIQVIKTSFAETQKENDYLSSNTESLNVQIAKLQGLVNEKSGELGKKLEKVRNKKKVLKEKLNQNKQILENHSREISQYKKNMQEQTEQYERTIQGMKGDMLTIKNEWEKRCNEVEKECQILINQSKTKYEMQAQKIKQEYQQLLDKKMQELDESTNQLNFSKGFNSQIQTKIQQIEKDYILKDQHEKILEEQIAKLEAKHQELINQISEIHQNNIQAKIKEISDRKSREYETLSQGLQNNCLDLQAKLQDQIKLTAQYKEKILEVENNFYKIKDEINQQNQYINVKLFFRSLQTLILIITFQKQLKGQNEDHLNHRKNLENEIQNYQQELDDIKNSKKQVEEALQEQLELSQMQSESIQKLQTNLEEYNQKEEQWQNENEELQNNLQQQYENQESLKRQLEQMKQKQEVERQSAVRNIQFQESIKLEKEKEEHEETKQKLLQLERKIKSIQKEQEKINEDYEERLQQMQEKSIKISGQKDKLEAEKKDLLIQFNEIQQKYETFTSKINRDKQRICKRLGLQLKSLKDDLSDIQNDSQLDITKIYEVSKQTIVQSIEHFNSIKQREINKLENQFRQNQEEILNEFNEKMEQIEENLRNQANSENVDLQNIIDQLKSENEQLQDKISSLLASQELIEKEKKKLESQISNLEKHNEKLEGIIKKNSEDMEEHNKFFATEIKRIKDESNSLVQLAVDSALQSSKQEIDILQKKIASLQAINEKAKAKEDTIYDLNREIQQREGNIDELQKHFEQNMKIKDEEIQKKENLIEKLRAELQEMQHIYEKMQEENNQAFEVLEKKLENYKQAISSEAQKYQMVKEQSNLEIQSLNEELEMVRQQLATKEQNIDNLAKYQELQTYSKRSQLPQQFIQNQLQSNQIAQSQQTHNLPPQPPSSHLNTTSSVFSTQRNTQQYPVQQTTYSAVRTLKQNNSASNLIASQQNNNSNSFNISHQPGNSSASKLQNTSYLNYNEKPVKLEGNNQLNQASTHQTQFYKQQAEKSYVKQYSLDKSFDAQRLDTLSDLSRQHKIVSQAKLASQQQNSQASLSMIKGSNHSPADINTPQPDNNNYNTQNNNRNLKTNSSSDSGLLFEIKLLLAQSYDLVNKNSNIASGVPVDGKNLAKQNSRGSLVNHGQSVTTTLNDNSTTHNTNIQTYGHIKSVGSQSGIYNNIPSSSTARLQKYSSGGNVNTENNQNKQDQMDEDYTSQNTISNGNIKKSLTSRYSTKNSDFSFKNSNN
ncbi:hypothetical protein ABPG74_021533 [Tetrahymena malaccensis]